MNTKDTVMISEKRITILMPTYNKGEFIAEAIESVLMQKVNYGFELIIIDDKSTDGSLKIAQGYCSKYPDQIKIIKNKTNEGCLSAIVKGYEQAKKEYLCVLDPDDYWTDENKLQNAVSFLDNHPDFTMYIANTYIDKDKIKTPYFNITQDQEFSFEQLNGAVWGHTSGVIFRNVIFKIGVPEYMYEAIGTKNEVCFRGDSFRNIIHLKAGKARVVHHIESVYRITTDGIWSSLSQFRQNTYNARFFLKMFLLFDKELPEFFITRFAGFCRANLELIKAPDSKVISAKDLSDFDEVLEECNKFYKTSENKCFSVKKGFCGFGPLARAWKSLFCKK